jgi:hypothetical protein
MKALICVLGIVAALAAGCGSESSVTDVGETPYHVEVELLDPTTGEVLPETVDVATWPIGLPDGPVVSITYWADRPTPPLSLAVRVVGAGLEGGTTTDGTPVDPCLEDPWAEGCFKAGGTTETGVAAIPLDMIDTEHRTVKIGVLPPALAGRAIITCVLGGASSSTPLEFTTADVAITAPAAGVADGASETPITVTGLAGQVVDLETSLGTFVAPGFANIVSVMLAPDEAGSTAGTAVVGLISDAIGPAIVSVGGSRIDWVRVDFTDVTLSLGDPVAIDFAPGQVVHELCVAANTMKGAVELAGTSAEAAVLDEVPQPLLAAEGTLPSSCPSGSFAGYALFRWAASGTTDTLTATWTGPGYGDPLTASRRVTGETFAGYGGTLDATPLDFDDPYPLLLEAHLTYLAVGGLDEQPAANVGVTFLVLSDWDAVELTADVSTGPDGTATAVYQVAADDTLQVFLQPEGWSTILLGSAP